MLARTSTTDAAAIAEANEILAGLTHDEWRALSHAERYELRILTEAEAGETPAEFITRLFPRQAPPRHLWPLLELFERARTERVRAVIHMPPRHGKTVSIGRALVWWLLRCPADLCAYATYSDAKAKSKSRMFRDWARKAGVQIRKDSDDVSNWRTLQGGGLLAAGAGGGLIGEGISGVMVVDDPYRSFAEAKSETVRETREEWFQSVVSTRLEGGSVIVMHQRWLDNDLIGTLLLNEPDVWESVTLGAMATANDPLGRKVGEALWPERFPVHVCANKGCGHSQHLDAIRRSLGTRRWSSMYQGTPQGVEGDTFKYGWFRTCRPDAVPEGGRTVRGWDLAGGEAKKSDWTVGVKIRETRGKLFVMDVRRAQVSPGDSHRLIQRTAEEDGPSVFQSFPRDPGISGLVAVKAISRFLRGFRFEFTPETGDKEIRAEVFSAQAEAGNVVIVKAAWNREYIEELTAFPLGAHDDQVDGSSRAYGRLLLRGGGLSPGAPKVASR